MFAIVEIAGKQYKVEKDQKIFVNRIDEQEGKKITFEKVLLLKETDKVEIGMPIVQGIEVKAKVLQHLKDDKITVFKKKRRKGYKVKNGHRTYLTKLEILDIGKQSSNSSKTKTVAKKTDEKKTVAKKTVAKKTDEKKTDEKKIEAKKRAVKKTDAKKTDAKKTDAKKTDAKKTDAKKTDAKKTAVKKTDAKNKK